MIAGVAAALTVVTGVGVAAAASSPTPSESGSPAPSESGTPTPSGTPSPVEPSEKPGRIWGPMKGGMFGAIHGEFVVPKEEGGFQTVSTQNGTVTAVDQASVTVRSEDGFSRTYTIADTTRVNGGREGIDSVEVNDQVTVLATVEAGKATATMVINMTRPEWPGWVGPRGGGLEWGPGPELRKRFSHGDQEKLKRFPPDSEPAPDSAKPEPVTPTPTT
ncbi:hypothetical protein [Acrocarpospora macrocephala]|uniref:hypothetical protein n=1 Tax=Acrocarpospora macrocephala TaxID=150177 RepID=UPI00158268A7|nr:hypothetical protein [Acrocarpospora macrocephala]